MVSDERDFMLVSISPVAEWRDTHPKMAESERRSRKKVLQSESEKNFLQKPLLPVASKQWVELKYLKWS